MRACVCFVMLTIASSASADPLAAIVSADSEITAATKRNDLDGARDGLDRLCEQHGRNLRAQKAATSHEKPLAALARRVARVFVAAGRDSDALTAYLCALEASGHDRTLDKAIAVDVERFFVRSLRDAATDASELRAVFGGSAWLIGDHDLHRLDLEADLRCIRRYIKDGSNRECSNMGGVLFNVLGGRYIEAAASIGDTLALSARVDLGLEVTDAKADAAAALARRIGSRWAPIGQTARWLRGLVRLQAGDQAASALMPEPREYCAGRWCAQLLLVRSRVLRDRGQVGDATADSAAAVLASRGDLRAIVEHAENLRASGRLREAEILLENSMTGQAFLRARAFGHRAIEACESGALPRRAERKARFAAQQKADLRLAGVNPLAWFAADVLACRATDPKRALELLSRCADDCNEDAIDRLRVVVTRYEKQLRAGGDVTACWLTGPALDPLVAGTSIATLVENDLGVTYHASGRYGDALKAFESAACYPATPDDRIRVLANLAGVLFATGKSDEAGDAIVEAISVAVRAAVSPRVQAALESNAGTIALGRGDLATANTYFASAAVHAKSLDPLVRATILDSVGIGEDLAGHHDAAERAYREALAVREAFGPEHPAIATSLSHLAALAWARGEPAKALPMFERMLALEEAHLVRLLVWGSERSKRDALARLTERLDWLVTYDRVAMKDARATKLALTAIASRQGRALDAAVRAQSVLFGRVAANATTSFEELRRANERIVWLELHAVRDEKVKRELAELHERVHGLGEKLADELGALDPEAIRALEGGVAELAGKLVPGQVLVNYVVYRPFHPGKLAGRYDPPHYAAYVLTRDARVAAVDLGPASVIDALSTRWREALAARADDTALAAEIHALVFAPIAGLLGDARDLLVVPDGALNLIPFDAFRQGADRLLAHYRVTMLTSARDLATATPRPGEGIVVFANPDYGAVPAQRDEAGWLGGGVLAPLPGTAAEASGIKRAFPDARLVLAGNATGTSFKAVKRPRILHVATHGFFLGAPAGERSTRGLFVVSPDQLGPLPDEITALARSGLAFANANQRDPGSIVAGLDLARVDLTGTQLVTLSACQTGVGVAAGDGVHGMRRALQLAGSETQVLSLWDVDDEATAQLMVAFYDKLRGGASRAEALREAKALVAATPRFAHPFFWAAFIASGSPNKLDGSPPEPVVVTAAIAGVVRPVRSPRGCGCGAGSGPDASLLVVLLAIALGRRATRRRARTGTHDVRGVTSSRP